MVGTARGGGPQAAAMSVGTFFRELGPALTRQSPAFQPRAPSVGRNGALAAAVAAVGRFTPAFTGVPGAILHPEPTSAEPTRPFLFDLIGADRSRAHLTGADLTGADLSRADLSEADLSGADLGAAEEHYTVALTLYQQIGARLGQANAHFGLGWAAQLRADYGAAEEHYTVALTLYQQIGDRLGQANAHLGLGEAARLRDDYGTAEEHYTVALTPVSYTHLRAHE